MSKLKSYTITCHRPLNYGAVLQAYALNTKLRSLGVDAKVIDYYPSYYKASNKSLLTRVLRQVFRLPDWIVGKKRFGKFIADNLPMTAKTYINIEELNADIPLADVYFAGSDQIWNCHELENGKDDAFFLSFAPKGAKKIAYAASLAMPKIPEEQVERYKSLINDFDAVAIREKDGLELVKSIGIEKAVNVLDPVYLLERIDWDKIADKDSFLPKEKYVLIYAFNRQKNIFEYARKMANELGIKVYSINTNIEDYMLDTDKYFYNASPNTFVNLIKNAEAVVTNSFHGLSFSVIYNKQFHLFTRKSSSNSRMVNLLSDLNLSGRIVDSTNLLKNDIDFAVTNEIVDQKRIFSVNYIKSNIFSDGNN
ncbi:polysaccharide pyruvyl transferase family protein [Flavobacterium fluviatile]|uniref:polysaccharide pyruvyl transferase family protein n=1 Tax=Flavobacterium fluviatile TaxID=1862387 RepID=UPI0013D14C4E|nr:polysaccharide pyruvyl transferase family protein [Flavobacterium fluviatile]